MTRAATQSQPASEAGGKKALAKREPQVVTLLRNMEGEIARALPDLGITGKRMSRMAMTALRNNPQLYHCEPMSVLACVVELAQLGLEPSTPLGHAWILPYGKSANIIIGYKGYVALAYRGRIMLSADVVYERDITDGKFCWQKGTNEGVEHIPYEGPDPGKIKYGYSIATYPDGRKMTKVITLADVQRAINASSSPKALTGEQKVDCAWYWMKTAIRRIAPFLPLSAEFVRATELDDIHEAGRVQILDYTPETVRTEVAADKIAADLNDAKADMGATPAEAGAEPA